MKKTVLFLLAVVYFAVSSGVVINLHYCMDRFASADLSVTGQSNFCEKCGMPKKDAKTCCHDQVKLVKLQADQYKTSFSFRLPLLEKTIAKTPVINFSLSFDDVVARQNFAHSPPLLHQQDTYLQNCVFRI